MITNNQHNCSELQNHVFGNQDSHDNTNGAKAEAIVKQRGFWYLIVNGWEYSVEINVCPFCGERLP